MGTRGQTRRCKDGVLVSLNRGGLKRIDLSHKDSIQVYVSDPGAEFAAADPTDRRAGEGERGSCARHIGFGDGPLAPGSVQVAVNPPAAVGDRRILLLEARARPPHIERIQQYRSTRRSAVPEARHLD